MLETFYIRDTEPNQALLQVIWRQKGSKVVLQQIKKGVSSKSWGRSRSFLLHSVA